MSKNIERKSRREYDEQFLEYLKNTAPDLYQGCIGTERLAEILQAHQKFLKLKSFKKRTATSASPLGAKRTEKLWAISILAIFFLAFFLRLLRVNFGLPYLYNYDETYIVRSALKMLKTGDFNPHFFNYPSLMIYLEFLVTVLYYIRGMSVGFLKNVHDIHFIWAWNISTPELYLWCRSLVAFFGAATVAVVYFIGSKGFDSRKAGIIGALFLAVSEAHIAHSIIIKVDIQTTFFLVASIYFSIMILRHDKWTYYIAAGIIAGLAVSSKYSAFWVIVPYILACALSWKDRKHALAKTVCGFLGLPIAFLAGTPYALTDFAKLIQDVGYEARHYGVTGHRGSTSEGNILFFLRWIALDAFGTPVIPLFAVAGIAIGAIRKRKEMLVALSFPVIHFFYISAQQIKFHQNMVPVLPFVALFAGLLALPEQLFKKEFAKWRMAPVAVAILIALWPGLEVLKNGWEIHFQKDTRTIAIDWMKQNLPPGAKVAIASELHVFIPELSGARFQPVEISAQNADLPMLRRLGINYYMTSRFKKDIGDGWPIEGMQHSFEQLEPLETFDGGYAYFDNPIENPKILIYKI